MANISERDQALFRQAIKGVKPLQHTKVNLIVQRPIAKCHPHHQPAASTQLPDLFADCVLAEPVTAEQALSYARPGLQHKTLRKLKRGHYPFDAELDLHGATIAESRQLLSQFLFYCKQNQFRIVCIIHGKGRRSQQDTPILKNKLTSWLRQVTQVSAFCSAQAKDGGTGAVYVLLTRL